jgi:succinate-acetate transporter protein
MNAAPHAAPTTVFADPTPLGLMGLAIGCAALTPIAFGIYPPDHAQVLVMLETAAWFCLLFGAGCQFLAGMMSLVNKNALGGTLFTTFAFNWVYNWFVLDRLAQDKGVNETVGFSVDIAFIVIFVVLTYAFGFFSKLLFAFMLDIDALYFFRILRHFMPYGSGGSTFANTMIGVSTVLLCALALYIAFALLVNPAAGRAVFPTSGPMFTPAPPPVSPAASTPAAPPAA